MIKGKVQQLKDAVKAKAANSGKVAGVALGITGILGIFTSIGAAGYVFLYKIWFCGIVTVLTFLAELYKFRNVDFFIANIPNLAWAIFLFIFGTVISVIIFAVIFVISMALIAVGIDTFDRNKGRKLYIGREAKNKNLI